MRRSKGKRSASSIVGCAPRCAEPHAETPEGVLPQPFRGGRPVSKTITSFVGLDVHKDSTAIGEAEAGRETPRFVGTVRSEERRVGREWSWGWCVGDGRKR